jgi:hypothetical protein
MKVKQIISTLECVAAIREADGAGDKAAALRSLCNAIAPLAAADISLLVEALTCERPVDTKAK